MPLLPPPSTTPPLFPLASCSAPPFFFFPGEGLRRDSGNSACSSSSNSSCSAHSSSFPSTSSLFSTVSNCCASATIAPVSVPSLSADLLYPLPPVPRVQRPWVRPVSHLPGGTRYPLRVEPSFGGRSKKQVTFDRGPDRCFSSSGGGVGSGYWRSHRPQKQRGQLHSRRRHFSHAAALNSSSSSTACSTAPIMVSPSSPSPFQKRRLAYQRFYNEIILSFPPVTEPEKTEFVPTFPCYPPAPLIDPSTVPRPLRVPMPTLCRLDFGLPSPPPPPVGRPSSSHLLFSPPPPPVPPPPPFPPGPPRFADDGGGVRFWLSRLARNRQAHAENGNTSSLASAPSVVSSSQSQSHFRSFLFSVPATSVPNHFDWFRDRFEWAVIRYACVGCHSDTDGPSEYDGYVQLDNSRSLNALSTRFGHSFTFLPVPPSFKLSLFVEQFSSQFFFEFGSPHRVHSSPLHRTNSFSSASCLSQPSLVSSPATGSQSRRWSCLTLSPNAAATFQPIASVPTRVESNDAALTPPASPVGPPSGLRGHPVLPRHPRTSTPDPLPSDASLTPSAIPVGPPSGFRGYPVLPRHRRTSPPDPLQITGAAMKGPLPPDLLHTRGRSSSPFRGRSRPTSSSVLLASDRRSSSEPRLSYSDVSRIANSNLFPVSGANFPRSPAPTASVLVSSTGRPSSSVRRALFHASAQSSSPSVLRPCVAPTSATGVTPLTSPPHRPGLSIRPTRASFVEPYDDPGAPGEELPSNPRDRIRYLCFTENNPTKSLEDFCDALSSWKLVSYYCIGSEWSSTGTHHFQGYLELSRQVSFSRLKRALPRAKLLNRRGTPQEAAVYCMKDGSFMEYGTRSSQGTRSDLNSVAESIVAGDPMSEVAAANPVTFIRYHRGMWALRQILAPDRTEPPEVRVFFGATGTGKSFRARQWLSDGPIYFHFSNQRGWFDGYQGERNCIFEEFRGQSDIALPHLLMILDRYPARVEVKGTFTMFSASKIAFTSPFHPAAWYSAFGVHEDYGQLARRITSIFDCTADPVRFPASSGTSSVLPLMDADPTLFAGASPESHHFPRPPLPPSSSLPAPSSPSVLPVPGPHHIRPRPSSAPPSKAPPAQRRPRPRGSPSSRPVRPRLS